MTFSATQILIYEAAPPPIKPEAEVFLTKVAPVAVTLETWSVEVLPITPMTKVSPARVSEVVVIASAVVLVLAPFFCWIKDEAMRGYPSLASLSQKLKAAEA